MLLSGQMAAAEDALRMGLVHSTHAVDALGTAADSAVTSILGGAPGALRLVKQQLLDRVGSQIRADWQIAAQISAAARGSAEAREGLQAFLENRAPSWAL